MGCAQSEPDIQTSKAPIHKNDTPPKKPIEELSRVPSPNTDKPKIKAVGANDYDSKAFGLLLCGTGESGKTTFTRQLRLKFLGGFDDKERREFAETIRGNLIETMQILLIWLDHHSLTVENDELAVYTSQIKEMDAFSADFNDEVASILKELWSDPNVLKAYEHKDETVIPDHMDYFFNKIDELASSDYVPSDEDILKARIRTIGVNQITFNYEGSFIRLYDVGGQKNERSKWEKCMQEVAGLVYCISLAEFDKPMFEDPEMKRLTDSLEIFGQLTHKEKFKESPFFLLCNKFDAFSKRIKATDCFKVAFPEYTGDIHNPDECARYIINKFIEAALPEIETRPIIDYKLIAIDSNSVEGTIDSLCKYIRDNYS